MIWSAELRPGREPEMTSPNSIKRPASIPFDDRRPGIAQTQALGGRIDHNNIGSVQHARADELADCRRR